LATVLTLGIAGPLAAQTSVNSPPPVGPNIPIVLGEVTDVTSHSVVVRTTRGENMTFETDSRTVMPMPMQMTAGRRVKVEFHLMENGNHHAGRITTIEPGGFDWEEYDRQMATYTRDVDDSDLRASNEDNRLESSTTGTNGTNGTDGTNGNVETRSNLDQDGSSSSDQNSTTTDRGDNVTNRLEDSRGANDELPQTASRQPMLLGLGLAALTLGLVIGFARRRRSV
jgi:LPXTG-motif cell wall-anchored protein